MPWHVNLSGAFYLSRAIAGHDATWSSGFTSALPSPRPPAPDPTVPFPCL